MPARRPGLVAGTSFLLFGISDFIEIGTGSWFRPLWLLLWKGVCVITIVSSYVWYRRLKRREGRQIAREEKEGSTQRFTEEHREEEEEEDLP